MAEAFDIIAGWILLRDALQLLTEAWHSRELASSDLTKALRNGMPVRPGRLQGRRHPDTPKPTPEDFFRPGACAHIDLKTSSARLFPEGWHGFSNYTLYLIRVPLADVCKLLPPGYPHPKKTPKQPSKKNKKTNDTERVIELADALELPLETKPAAAEKKLKQPYKEKYDKDVPSRDTFGRALEKNGGRARQIRFS
jgi:hypothetical protein